MADMPAVELTVRAFAFVFGAMMGSFLNVCVARWPAGLSVVHPRSRCPHCAAPIAWYDNVPIVSWLVLRARCRACGVRISPIYPIIELSVAMVWLAAFIAFGPTFMAVRVAVFVTLLLGIAVTDLRHYLIPDGFTVFGLTWVLATATVGYILNSNDPFVAPWAGVIGACTGAGAIAIAGWLGEVAFRKEAMGFGDVTLMAMVGAAVGPERALLTIFLAALLGVATLVALLPFGLSDRVSQQSVPDESSKPSRHVPFGVFLAPASLVTLIWGESLLSWYLRIAGAR